MSQVLLFVELLYTVMSFGDVCYSNTCTCTSYGTLCEKPEGFFLSGMLPEILRKKSE